MRAAELGDPPQDAVDRRLLGELEVGQVAGTHEEVDVGVVEAGQDEASAGVERGRTGAGQRPNLLV
jgi:hypothetical protein